MIQHRLASSARMAARVARPQATRLQPRVVRQPRFQSTSTTANAPSGGASHAMIGAATGSIVTLAIGYIFYRQSGARELLMATKATKNLAQSATQKLKDAAPEPNEALQWLKSTAKSYAFFIPGASAVIDTAFKDLDTIRSNHGDEVDRIVSDAYNKLRDVIGKGDMSLLTAQKAWNVILDHLGQIGELAGDAAQQVLENHPELQKAVGGSLDSLKEMARNYGPDAKKEVDRTWDQISDILKTGMSTKNIEKIRNLVQEKTQKLKKLGDTAWEKGLEEAKPYLDKNPEVKKLIEKNADNLKKGNWQELYKQVKKAVDSGNMGDLDKYVKQFTGKSSSDAFEGVQQSLKNIPGGSEIFSKLGQIREAAEKHGDEAQDIMKDAVSQISKILKEKADEAAQLAKKASKDAKK